VGEEVAIRRCVRRGQPYGREAWVAETVKQLGLGETMRAPGRPPKHRSAGPWLPFGDDGFGAENGS